MTDGIQFGRYTLVDRIATGGMAELFLARYAGEAGFEKTCVIKKVLPHLAGAPGFKEMFLDEARIVARLEHPSIVQIYDVGREGDDYFLALEYLAGEDLLAMLGELRLNKKQTPLDVAAKVMSVTCEALHYAHEARAPDGSPLNIVHRDISPSNIFVTYTGTVKLLDFGIAHAEQRLEQTQVGLVKGKQAYMSPEQSLGQPLDRRADVWSLGVVFWELLTGRRLFQRDNADAMRRAVLLEDMPRPSQYRAEVPRVLDEAVMAALERDASKRLPTADALRARLDTFLSDSTYVSSTVQLSAFMKATFGAERMESRLHRKVSLQTKADRPGTAPLEVEGPTELSSQPKPKPRSAVAGVVLRMALVAVAIAGALAAGWTLKAAEPAAPPALVSERPAPEVPAAEPPPDNPPEPSPAVPAKQRPPAMLAVESAEEADVLIDGKRVGTAPVKVKVTPGPHTVQLTSASFGRAPATRVTARSGESTSYREPFALGRLNVSVKPWADVYLDGAKIGQTPLAGRPAAAGAHQLRLVAPSGEKTLEVRVPKGATVTVNETIP